MGNPDPIAFLLGYLDDVMGYSPKSCLSLSEYSGLLKEMSKYDHPGDDPGGEFAKMSEEDLCTACDHYLLLDRIFTRLRFHNFKIKVSKLKLFQDHAETLGVVIDKDGLRVDHKRRDKILATTMPKTLKEMQAYCGFLSSIGLYTSNHMSHHHGVLSELTSAKKDFVIEERHKTAFEDSKKLLTTEPLFLHFPDQYKPKVLFVDSSDILLGAVLLQVDLPPMYLKPQEERQPTLDDEGMILENKIIKEHGLGGYTIYVPSKQASSFFESLVEAILYLGIKNVPTDHKLLRHAVISHLESSMIRFPLASDMADKPDWQNFLKKYRIANSGIDTRGIILNASAQLLERNILVLKGNGTKDLFQGGGSASSKPAIILVLPYHQERGENFPPCINYWTTNIRGTPPMWCAATT